MALDVVLGERRNTVAIEALRQALEPLGLSGTLYVGYPVLATLEEPVFVDALLTCREHSVVVFDLQHPPAGCAALRDAQNELFLPFQTKLLESKPLRKGRQLKVALNVITVDPAASESVIQPDLLWGPPSDIARLLSTCEACTDEDLQVVNAAIQRVTSLRPQNRRTKASTPGSKGSRLRTIEVQIANLDSWQKAAAIESPDGPQRIRGLAGSGKTVVLALKAALLHAAHPDWNIAVTFHTRSLYQQFQELVRRFTFEHTRDDPDWDRLRILHSWGAPTRPGVYSEICSTAGLDPMSFSEARDRFGPEGAFRGVCESLKHAILNSGVSPVFDAILIDEGQDLPPAFFELAYLMTKPPHRVIFAYDELQTLNEHSMAPPQELFGHFENGHPRVGSLTNSPGAPKQDIVLPVCYRNTPWALTVAHALGFGIYREGGLVQFFDSPVLWNDIGYSVIEGAVSPGHKVVLQRSPAATPDFFGRLLNADEAVVCRVFKDADAQAEWVAAAVQRNLGVDELDHRDILIVFPDPIAARRDSSSISAALASLGIRSHLAGVTSSVDRMFNDHSVALSGIHRAKGNEAAVVYVVNAQYGADSIELIRRRNSLFTGITRSRGWVCITGHGERMARIAAEVKRVRDADFKLDFAVPTQTELAALRRLHRERSNEEIRDVHAKRESIRELAAQVEQGELPLEVLIEGISPEIRAKLLERLSSDT